MTLYRLSKCHHIRSMCSVKVIQIKMQCWNVIDIHYSNDYFKKMTVCFSRIRKCLTDNYWVLLRIYILWTPFYSKTILNVPFLVEFPSGFDGSWALHWTNHFSRSGHGHRSDSEIIRENERAMLQTRTTSQGCDELKIVSGKFYRPKFFPITLAQQLIRKKNN